MRSEVWSSGEGDVEKYPRWKCGRCRGGSTRMLEVGLCRLWPPRRRTFGASMCSCSAERQCLAVLYLLRPRVVWRMVYLIAETLISAPPFSTKFFVASSTSGCLARLHLLPSPSLAPDTFTPWRSLSTSGCLVLSPAPSRTTATAPCGASPLPRVGCVLFAKKYQKLAPFVFEGGCSPLAETPPLCLCH